MRKIAALNFEYNYANSLNSEARTKRFYDWLVNKAIDNLLKSQKDIDNNSTQKYIKDNGQSGSIFNSRRGSKNSQSKKDYNLSDVPSGQTPCSQVWQGLENQKLKTNRSIGG